MFSQTVASFVQGVVLLGEVADLESVPRLQCSGVRGFGSGQQAQQGGLACAVEPEHHHPRAPVDRQVDPGEDLQRTVGLGQPLGHQRGLAARRRVWGT